MIKKQKGHSTRSLYVVHDEPIDISNKEELEMGSPTTMALKLCKEERQVESSCSEPLLGPKAMVTRNAFILYYKWPSHLI